MHMMKSSQSFAFCLLVGAFLVLNVNARLPPPEYRPPSAPSTPADASKPASDSDNPAVSSSSDSVATSDQDSFENSDPFDMRQTMQLMNYLRQHLHLMSQDFPSVRMRPSILRPHNSMPGFHPMLPMHPFSHMPSLFSGSDEENSGEFNPLRDFNLNRFSFKDPIANGFHKINETKISINGREICQTIYEKVENNGYGMFSSRIITAQPCEKESKNSQEESATSLPAVEDKKQGDRSAAKPEVEREDNSTEKPTSSESNNQEPNEVKPQINKEQDSTPSSSGENLKPKDKSAENEIADKPAEPNRVEPSITVNDGK